MLTRLELADAWKIPGKSAEFQIKISISVSIIVLFCFIDAHFKVKGVLIMSESLPQQLKV
tara:strand:- start:59 stop:238 length:180 start_codon:yes stop_codon:yes gene_type:complete